jgi:hypothetical protein
MYLNLIDFYPRVGFWEGIRDVYIVQGQQESVTQTDGVLSGNGWFVGNVQFHKEVDSDGILGNGTYDIEMNNTPGYVQAGWFEIFSGVYVGLWVHRVENDRMVQSIAIVSGTVLVTHSNGMYVIEIDGFDANGVRYTGSIYNKEPIVPPVVTPPIAPDVAAPKGAPIQRAAGRAAVNPKNYRMQALAKQQRTLY